MSTGGRRRAAFAALVALLWLGSPPAPAAAATTPQVRTASIALAREASDLIALQAFPSGEQLTALTAALQGVPLGTPSSRDAVRRRLTTDDQAGSTALTRLEAAHANVTREVRTALTRLTGTQLAAIDRRATIAEPESGLYLKALEDLVSPNPVQGSRPDPQKVQAGLAEALGVALPGAGPTDGPAAVPVAPTATPKATSSVWPWYAGVAGVLVLGAAAVVRLSVRRRAAPSFAIPPALPTQRVPIHSVLDASRRLTTLTGGEDMPRAIVREALALVPSFAAALVERRGDDLVTSYESRPDLLRPEGFRQGVVDSAANAGQLLTQLVTADASFARLPAQVLLLPLVSAGRVDAVVVLVRDANETFTPAEREVLATFAPVAAAARDSAARTQAAVDASQVDPLTGAGNRRQLDTHLPEVLREAAGGSTGFFMIDLDHFKKVNDTYGHPAGDAMLRAVCATIRGAVRPTDGVYRYGGEEFCVLLPSTTLEETQDIAERVRAAITTTRYDLGSAQLMATASLGVAVTSGTDGAALIESADRALYAAKSGGRNRVCSA
jgi:diguanylate cyclase (GGDEF)-like protein